jgi:hypothetical protein
MKIPTSKAATSADLDSLAEELRFAGSREDISAICTELADHLRAFHIPEEHWAYVEIGRGPKKNFAQRLSTAIAQKVADAIRPTLKGIYPDAAGRRHEARAMGAAGPKKLDVVYMTQEMGVGLAVSIKTINFKDEKTKRYTKNIKRVDGELRAEAADYHRRQPYAVFGALIFLPADSASDGPAGKSSLRHAWEVFHRRGGREQHGDDQSLFEVVYLCVYESCGENAGRCRCYSVAQEMPLLGLPDQALTLTAVMSDLLRTFERRNRK